MSATGGSAKSLLLLSAIGCAMIGFPAFALAMSGPVQYSEHCSESEAITPSAFQQWACEARRQQSVRPGPRGSAVAQNSLARTELLLEVIQMNFRSRRAFGGG
jgi:hypothetical protein